MRKLIVIIVSLAAIVVVGIVLAIGNNGNE